MIVQCAQCNEDVDGNEIKYFCGTSQCETLYAVLHAEYIPYKTDQPYESRLSRSFGCIGT